MFTVNRTALHDELAILTSVVVPKNHIGVLTTVMLGCDGERLLLTGTNLDASIETMVPATGDPWGGCVPAHTLAALVKLLSEEEITFKPKDTRLQVKCGPSKHLLPLWPIAQFPEIDRAEGEPVSLPAALLSEMVKAVSFAMMPPSDTLKPADFKFTGLSIRSMEGKLEVMASKKTVTAIAEAPIDAALLPILLPSQAIRALELLLEGEIVAIQANANHVEFTCGHRTLIARQLTGEFPVWRQFIPEYQYQVQVDRAQFKAGLQRALLTMGIDNAVGFEPLRLTFTKEQVVIESKGGDRGKSEESVTITSNLNGKPVVLGVVGAQVLSVLRGEQVRLSLMAESPLIFTETNDKFTTTAIVMPTSLRQWG